MRDDNESGAIQPMGAGGVHGVASIAQIEATKAIQEIQAALVIAATRPRNEIRAREKVMKACDRPELASVAVYEYSRGGTDISGPTIRLAEVLARCWGNINFGFRELSNANGCSEVEAYCWDLEANVRAERRFSVPHRRDTKKGSYALTDARDIYEAVANQSQRRVRACILEMIPGDIVEDAVAECGRTMKAYVLKDGKTMADVIKETLTVFAAWKVSKEQIEKWLGHKLTPEATSEAEIAKLWRISISMRDGMSTPDDWFEPVAPESGLSDKLKGKQEQPKSAPRAEKTRHEPPAHSEQAGPPHEQEPKAASTPRQDARPNLPPRIHCARDNEDKAAIACASCDDAENCPERRAWLEQQRQ